MESADDETLPGSCNLGASGFPWGTRRSGERRAGAPAAGHTDGHRFRKLARLGDSPVARVRVAHYNLPFSCSAALRPLAPYRPPGRRAPDWTAVGIGDRGRSAGRIRNRRWRSVRPRDRWFRSLGDLFRFSSGDRRGRSASLFFLTKRAAPPRSWRAAAFSVHHLRDCTHKPVQLRNCAGFRGGHGTHGSLSIAAVMIANTIFFFLP